MPNDSGVAITNFGFANNLSRPASGLISYSSGFISYYIGAKEVQKRIHDKVGWVMHGSVFFLNFFFIMFEAGSKGSSEGRLGGGGGSVALARQITRKKETTRSDCHSHPPPSQNAAYQATMFGALPKKRPRQRFHPKI